MALLCTRATAAVKSKRTQSEALTKHDMLELITSPEFTSTVHKAMETTVKGTVAEQKHQAAAIKNNQEESHQLTTMVAAQQSDIDALTLTGLKVHICPSLVKGLEAHICPCVVTSWWRHCDVIESIVNLVVQNKLLHCGQRDMCS